MATEPDVDEVGLEDQGRAWIVRVLGRARGGQGATATPLLLLGFWPADSGDTDPVREALVVGSLLSALSDARLREALERSVPYEDSGSETGVFGEAHQRQGR